MVKGNLIFIVAVFGVLELVTVMGMPHAAPVLTENEINEIFKSIPRSASFDKRSSGKVIDYKGVTSGSQPIISSTDAAAKYGGFEISDSPSRVPSSVQPETQKINPPDGNRVWTTIPQASKIPIDQKSSGNLGTDDFATAINPSSNRSTVKNQVKNPSKVTKPNYQEAENDLVSQSTKDTTNELNQLADKLNNLKSLTGSAFPEEEIALDSPRPGYPVRRTATPPSPQKSFKDVQNDFEYPNEHLNEEEMPMKISSPRQNYPTPPSNPSATPDEYIIPANGDAQAARKPRAGERQFDTRVRKVSSIKEEFWQPTIRTAPINAPWVPKNLDYNLYKDGILERSNMYRAQHGAPPLVYSKKLSEISQNYALELLYENKFGHNYDNSYGENLADYWRPSEPDYQLPPNKPVDQWYNEIEHYSFETGRSFDGVETGHFEQLVWKSSAEVGIGIAKNKEGKYVVVCTYNPGSYSGGNRENVLKAK